MTDRYERIRKALAMGPTPGPWSIRYDYVVQAKSFDAGRLVPIAQPYGVNTDGTDLFANAHLIAACDPDTIRALLAERDALIHDNAEYVRAANELAAENERLREELDQLRQDAARYRWLRDPCSGAERVIFYCRGDYGRGLMSSAMLDAAIDDAIQHELGDSRGEL